MSRPPNRRRRGGNAAFAAFAVVIVAGAAVGGDYLLGRFQDTAMVREHARLFREEVAFLRLPTLNLVPRLDHSYEGTLRPEGDRLMPEGTARSLRTDGAGAIVGGAGKGAKTLLFLGGSTTECNEVDEPFRFPSVAERLLKEAGASVRAVNGGVRGHTTQDSINALLNRPGFRDAGVVVMMHNINDRLRLAAGRGYEAQLGTDAPTTAKAVQGAFGGLLSSVWEWASYRSNALFMMRTVGSRLNPFTGDGGEIVVNERAIDFKDDRLAEHVAEYARNLRIFVASVRILGKTPVLMTQPLGVDSPEQGRFNQAVRDVAKNDGVMLVDLELELGGDRQWAFLSDNIHMNNSGSATIGALVAARLAPLVDVQSPVKDGFAGLAPVNPSDLAARCMPAGEAAPKPGHIQRLLGRSGRYPSFSPDGRYLLFQTFSDGLERMAAYDTANRRYLDLTPADSGESERHPAFLDFTKDGFRVVYGSSKGQGTFETLKVRRWPQGDTEALPLGELGGAIPAVGHDALLFPGFMPSGQDRTPNLHRFDLKTRQVSRILTAAEEQWRPAVAPDGTLYFIAGGVGRFDIHRVRPGADRSEPFFGSAADEWDPAISPDGRWVAFASKMEGTWDIFVAGSEGALGPVRLTSWQGEEWDPAFDPTGRMLVFAASSGSAPSVFGMCLYGERER